MRCQAEVRAVKGEAATKAKPLCVKVSMPPKKISGHQGHNFAFTGCYNLAQKRSRDLFAGFRLFVMSIDKEAGKNAIAASD